MNNKKHNFLMIKNKTEKYPLIMFCNLLGELLNVNAKTISS